MSGHSNFVLVRAGLLGGDYFDARTARPSFAGLLGKYRNEAISSALPKLGWFIAASGADMTDAPKAQSERRDVVGADQEDRGRVKAL
jgi:hypothetical protein